MQGTIKPLGGIASLKLGVAGLGAAAPTLQDGGVAIPLLEDRSTYSEVTAYLTGQPSVKHTIVAITPIEYTLPTELIKGLQQGFIAQILFNSRREICVGWSTDALFDRALRLVSCTSKSGAKASERGYKEWLFESLDSQTSI